MADHAHSKSASAVLANLDKLLPEIETLYKDIHSHPELSMRETRTAGIAADRLKAAGYEVTTGVGHTGVVGLLRNGDGPTVMLRADMDALPIAENTGLAYASKVTATDAEGNTVPVGHMCGHDMHVAWLTGAATLLSGARNAWKGTLMVVFQPGEETAQGAQAMIDDGLLERFPSPDVVLGQHVMVGPAGTVAGSAGPITSAADSLQIRLFGRGAHGSMPQASVDPVVMAASVVLRLQTIVSREVAATDAAVVTVGVLQAGTKENVIPDDAVIKLNVRTFDAGVRKHVLAAIERIVNAEAEASGAPRKPEITPLDRYPLNINDETASNRIAEAFRGLFLCRAGEAYGAGAGERGFRLFRHGMAGAVGVLVRRRQRSQDLCRGQGGRQAERTAGQPQSAIRAGPASHIGNRGRGLGRRGTGVARCALMSSAARPASERLSNGARAAGWCPLQPLDPATGI